MGESMRISFARLFEVRVLHHYWLDEGATVLDALPAAEQARRLLRYDARRVVGIVPDPATLAVIDGMGGRFLTTGLGCVVAVPEDASVPLEHVFTFFVTARDRDYAGYTALTLRDQRTVDVVDPADPTAQHRYKANVPLLSNATGASRGAGAAKRLFLSSEYPGGAGDGVEALVVSGSTVRQLTSDPPAATFLALGARSDLPVYVHQGDAPATTPPAGSTGAPSHGIEMPPDAPPTVIAVLRLHPRRSDDDAFSFARADGTPRTPSRVFEMHLRNRSTIWRYLDKRTGAIASSEPAPLPMTRFGSAGTKQRPSPRAVSVETDAAHRITALVSDIHI